MRRSASLPPKGDGLGAVGRACCRYLSLQVSCGEAWQSAIMKICPFCKESVQDEAIKCAHCQSMLLPLQLSEPEKKDTDRVTYILDQDLVRFGKFAAAVLALFLVVGGYLFGFKLEAGLDKVQQTQEKSKEIQTQFTKAQTELQTAQKNVEGIQAQFTKAQSELEAARQKVEQLRTSMEDQFA
jgi:exonuclease VII small subunit